MNSILGRQTPVMFGDCNLVCSGVGMEAYAA